PLKGYEILKDLKMLTDELVIVRSHHERFDGKGYPDHKPGDQLPVYAWIASAADAVDAMTSDRPYRKGMSMEVALEEISKGSGTPSMSCSRSRPVRLPATTLAPSAIGGEPCAAARAVIPPTRRARAC